MKGKILVTYRIPEESLTILENEGYTLIWPEGVSMSEAEIVEKIPECIAVVSVFATPLPDKAMEIADHLRIISNYGAGVDNINIPFATDKGIVVTNTPDEVTEPTAEMAVALMLALARRIPEMDRRLRSHCDIRWGIMENLGTTLRGKTLGIIGLGRIGKATARRALALGMKIVYHNRHRAGKKTEKQLDAKYITLEALLENSEVISLHIPLTPETHHLIDKNAFGRMKPGVLIVNTARGAVIDEKALIDALRSGQIAGAALDVFENEPEIPEALLKMDQVVVAPHVGTATWETRVDIGRRAALNIIEYFGGKDPVYCVNPDVLDHKSNHGFAE
ncbi:MAG: hydroxyacid dehydrogenase [Chlorobi bacterium]|nr:hydroxyacid dehydrogenase [Chlorobiota bacterium]